MSELKNRIEKWLVNPRKFISTPVISSASRAVHESKDVSLQLKSLSCVRKNEASKDEVVILGFWLFEDNDSIVIDGIIHLGNEFSEEGEVFSMNLSIPLTCDSNKATFCFMVYEEDAPILLDPHDPIGLAAFHQNSSVSVYKGDFREEINPLTYALNISKSNEIEFDAGDNGCYRLSYGILEI
ncbi:hypothetical protein R50073_42770 [Maricurvus nonylphenolicus]|uniref:hypothetical protein n=1 Tax=Maricurvus nonylphenolicus TaxID=1008307 RepID=UPI0036F31DBA